MYSSLCCLRHTIICSLRCRLLFNLLFYCAMRFELPERNKAVCFFFVMITIRTIPWLAIESWFFNLDVNQRWFFPTKDWTFKIWFFPLKYEILWNDETDLFSLVGFIIKLSWLLNFYYMSNQNCVWHPPNDSLDICFQKFVFIFVKQEYMK